MSRMGVAGSNGRSGKSDKDSGPASFKITIPSEFPAGRDVQKRIVDKITRLGFTSQSQFGIKVALEEALINAIKHGNREHPKKKVRIAVKATPRQLEVVIED